MSMLCMMPTPEMLELMSMRSAFEMILVILAVLPILLACILLNRLIFNSADMINGAING